MANTLTTYDFSKPSNLTKTDRRSYPWDEWLNGHIWELKHGVDFEAHPLMMERIIRTRATAKKAQIEMRHEPLNGDESYGRIIVRRRDVTPARVRKAAPAKAVAKVTAKKVAAKVAPVAKKVAPKKATTRPKGGVHHPGPNTPTKRAAPAAKKAVSKKAPARR